MKHVKANRKFSIIIDVNHSSSPGTPKPFARIPNTTTELSRFFYLLNSTDTAHCMLQTRLPPTSQHQPQNHNMSFPGSSFNVLGPLLLVYSYIHLLLIQLQSRNMWHSPPQINQTTKIPHHLFRRNSNDVPTTLRCLSSSKIYTDTTRHLSAEGRDPKPLPCTHHQPRTTQGEQ